MIVISTKQRYYELAKNNATTIEEVDCYIEEYKNVKKINIPNTCALIASLGSLFVVTVTSLFSTQAGLQGVIYSKVLDAYMNDPSNKLDDFGDFGVSEITNMLSQGLAYLMVTCLAIAIVGWIYNVYNQKRLSGFYEYKRELLKQKNSSH